jgi:hypothetical protein
MARNEPGLTPRVQQVKRKARVIPQQCEQLKSWWNFCTQKVSRAFDKKFTPHRKECTMSFQQPLSPEQEAKAQELVARLRPKAEEDLLAVARLLVSKEDGELFGETELEVRDLVHRIGAKAYTEHLARKKTATRDPESSAPIAAKAPSSKAGGTKPL